MSRQAIDYVTWIDNSTVDGLFKRTLARFLDYPLSIEHPTTNCSAMATLIRPPPVNPSQSAIENTLELTQLSDIDPNLFTNSRPLWHPPGARGIFGGAAIAQTLSAAQKTVQPDFTVHSMHCYFVLAGDSEIPIIYHVEKVRSGKSFATRTVQARQRGNVIFTTTISFVRQNSAGDKILSHAVEMPDVPGPIEGKDDLDYGGASSGPFQSQRIEILNSASATLHLRPSHQSPVTSHQSLMRPQMTRPMPT